MLILPSVSGLGFRGASYYTPGDRFGSVPATSRKPPPRFGGRPGSRLWFLEVLNLRA